MTAKLIHDMPGLLDVIRARRDQLNISHQTIDELAGLPSGYTGKVLAPEPVRGVGYMSLGAIMGAVGLALVVVEDSEAATRMRRHWTPRKRLPKKAHSEGSAGALLGEAMQCESSIHETS